MRTVYLHIGASKTGTSALQAHFTINREILSSHNIYYPQIFDDERAKNFQITSGNASQLALMLVDYQRYENDISNIINTFITEATGKNILLSSEILQRVSNDGMLFFKDELGKNNYRIKVVYYIRAIADHLISAYHQKVKRHMMSSNPIEMIENENSQFLKRIEKFIKLFGKDNIVLKNYDLVEGNIFKEFLQDVLNIDELNHFIIKNKKVNRSLTQLEVELMRYLNKSFTEDKHSTFVSDALIKRNPEVNYKMTINRNYLEKIELYYGNDIDKINSYLPERERPFKLINKLQIADHETTVTMNQFQKSIASIIAEIIKEIRK